MACLSIHGSQPDSVYVLRPVQSIYSVEAGGAGLTDTYLTPLKYSGWEATLKYERTQAMRFSPENWVMQLEADLSGARTVNPTRNRVMYQASLGASWSMMHRWRLPMGFSAGLGGEAAMSFGALYLDRGGNNPASAKASCTVGAKAYVMWSTKLRSVPIRLRYQGAMPITGAFFAPEYGELYYEIYMGNHSSLAHWAWWGNYFAYRHSLTADFQFGTTTLRLGYSGRWYTTDINHTVTNISSHCGTIGIGGEWLSLAPSRKLSRQARIISATY